MSQHDTADRDDRDEQPELSDPDDYHRKQRLKEIHQRRRQVAKQLDQMEPYTNKDGHGQQKRKLANAVSLYIAELEPIEKRTDAEIELRDKLVWPDATDYADKMGYIPKDDENDGIAGYEESHAVYRACNEFLAKVKPLIEEQENAEWEITTE